MNMCYFSSLYLDESQKVSDSKFIMNERKCFSLPQGFEEFLVILAIFVPKKMKN